MNDPQLAHLLLSQDNLDVPTDSESKESHSIKDESKKYVVGLHTRNTNDQEIGITPSMA